MAYPLQRPGVLGGIVACLVIVAVLQILAGWLLFALAFPFVVCDAFYIVLAAMDLIVAVGVWQMQGWARTSAIILGVIGAILSFPLGTVPAVILLVYVSKPEVKAAFGQGPPVPPPMWGYAPPYVPGSAAPPMYPPGYPPIYPPPGYPPAAPPAGPPAAPTPARSKFCRSCGSPLDPTATSCPACGTRIS